MGIGDWGLGIGDWGLGVNDALQNLGTTPLRAGCKAYDLIGRPQVTLPLLAELVPGLNDIFDSLPN